MKSRSKNLNPEYFSGRILLQFFFSRPPEMPTMRQKDPRKKWYSILAAYLAEEVLGKVRLAHLGGQRVRAGRFL